MPACTECFAPLAGPQCNRCGAWSLTPAAGGVAGNSLKTSDLIDAADVEASQIERIVTGGPWDAAWGGGIVPGSVTSLVGAAGGGKSTLALQAAVIMARMTKRPSFYVSGEQSQGELRWTLDRLGISLGKGEILLAKSMQSSGLLDDATLAARPPSSIIIDSLTEICGTKNYDAQAALSRAYKPIAVKWRCPVFLIVQLNKAGNSLGLNALQHGPDALIEVQVIDDGRRRARILREYGLDDGDIRLLTPIKNRFGATHIDHPMLMTEHGFTAIPKQMQRSERKPTGDPIRDEILALDELAAEIEASRAAVKDLQEEYEDRKLKLAKMATEPAKVVALPRAKKKRAPSSPITIDAVGVDTTEGPR